MMGKAAGAHLGGWLGATYLGGESFGIGATWGKVVGSVVGGRLASIAVDQIETEIFRQMGIE